MRRCSAAHRLSSAAGCGRWSFGLMGAGASGRRRGSLPLAVTPEVAARQERLELAGMGDETLCTRPKGVEENIEADDNTPRSKSILLNRAMTEALRRNNIDECATLGRELMEMPVQWLAKESGEENGRPMLSKVDKPNRAILAAVCGAKAAKFEQRGWYHDAQYARKLAAMFASSLGPAECLSKEASTGARASETELLITTRRYTCATECNALCHPVDRPSLILDPCFSSPTESNSASSSGTRVAFGEQLK